MDKKKILIIVLAVLLLISSCLNLVLGFLFINERIYNEKLTEISNIFLA